MATLQIRLLSTGTICTDNGTALTVRARKELAVLVYLLLEQSQPHSRESLQALFWQDFDNQSARNNLRVVLSHLQALLPAEKNDHKLLLANRNEVTINPEVALWVDALEFQRLIEKTQRHDHASRSNCSECQQVLLAAVDLYTAEFLAGFALNDCPAYEEWLFMQRERLHVLILEAYSDLAIYAENKGDLRAARSFAQRQIELDPLREPAYRQQMRILARLGERSAALAMFERCRKVLREELGLDPELETRSLFGQLLEGDVADDATASQSLATDASAPGGALRYNFPQQLTAFIGREEELAQFRQRLLAAASRLYTIVGPGGMGKTRLALQIALEQLNRFANGVCFVPLASVQSVSTIPTAMMEALGVSLVQGATSPSQQLFNYLAKRQMLLVIDNFEHLIEGVPLLLDLLQAAPDVTILVTSREQLNCQAEDLFALHGLATPSQANLVHASDYASVRLFCDRAYRLTKHFKLTPANASAVVKICQQVEGMPLAIELATTWLHDYDCADLATMLAKGQALLATTQQDLPVRHRSMQAVFSHSWQLLNSAEQRILSQLAVCPGTFSSAVAAAMTGASLIDLTRLRHKSLLRSGGSGYYEFHPLIRSFALSMLDQATRCAAEARMAETYLQTVINQTAALHGSAPQSALQLIGRELDNMQQAWQWAEAQGRFDLLLKSIEGLGEFYVATGRSAEGEALVLPLARKLLANFERCDETSKQLCLHLLDELCRNLIWQSKIPNALTYTKKMVALARQEAQHEFEARGLNHWGKVLREQGQVNSAQQRFEEALVIARQVAQPALLGDILNNLGNTVAGMGQRRQAEAYLQEGLQIQREQGNRMAEQRLLLYLSLIKIENGEYQAGQRDLMEALHYLQLTGNRPTEARIVNALGYTDAMLGNYTAALERHHTSRRISREIQQPVQESHALHNLCTVERKRGNLELAEEYGQEALRLALVYDLPDAVNYARLHLGYVWLAKGDLEEAALSFQLAADGWQTQQSTNLQRESLVGVAAVAYRQDQLQQAADLIRPIVPILLECVPDNVDEPYEMVLTCYRILTALQDERAAKLLATAHAQLQSHASKITDRQLRHTFWQAPAHCQVHELWLQQKEQARHKLDSALLQIT
ncbi:MAG: BTAD domain-containing putative transcriptional regulator [Caldilineaceae bacterium]